MRKVFIIILCVVFACGVVSIPCFATRALVTPVLPDVEWLSQSPFYAVAFNTGSNAPADVVTVAYPFSVGDISFVKGDTLYWTRDSNFVLHYTHNGVSSTYVTYASAFPATLYIVESSYTSLAGNTVSVNGSTYVYLANQGFVDTGFRTALDICGDVVHYILNNTLILVAIGLAVAVPLVGWGIGKVKTLIVGY